MKITHFLTGVLLAASALTMAGLAQAADVNTFCYTFTLPLYYGLTDASTNGEVSPLQTALTKEGFNVSWDGPGRFLSFTRAAVVNFQRKYAISTTGTVGPLTRAKLNSLYGCATATITTG